MTEQQIKWAKSHDWYRATLATNDGVLCLDQSVDRQGVVHEKDVVFHDFRALLRWAGY